MRHVAIALLLLSAPVNAQDLAFSIEHSELCEFEASTLAEKQACIGRSADHCMDVNPGGDSTYGMSSCLYQEHDYWDRRLNDVYAHVMREAKQFDVEMREFNSDLPSQAEALKSTQRAWISFRDATCEYERTQWGGGMGGGPAFGFCLMNMTGQQVLYLESMRIEP